ncbi:MAG: MBL fold metallo-hydrolase [Thermodesulfobacteriota bacterium]
MKDVRITYVGHATVLIELGGKAFLTDPVFTDRIATVRRQSPPGLLPRDLPRLSAILISYGHYDHLDLASLAMLDPRAPAVTPLRASRLLPGKNGRRFVELGYEKSWEAGEVSVTAVPARHFGGRFLVDSLFRPAAGFVLKSAAACAYFAGDTAYSGHFTEIGRRHAPDIAILPIGAYRPRFVMRSSHMDPAEALQAFADLGAQIMIPMHWGAFALSLEPMDEPVRRLSELAEKQGLRDRVKVLEPGSFWESP